MPQYPPVSVRARGRHPQDPLQSSQEHRKIGSGSTLILIKRKENGYETLWILNTEKNEFYVELMGKRLRKTHNEKNFVRRNEWVFFLLLSQGQCMSMSIQ